MTPPSSPGLLNLLVSPPFGNDSHASTKSSEDLLEHICQSANQHSNELADASPDQLASSIRLCLKQANLAEGHLTHLDAYKKALCWTIGKMLLSVKSQLEKGEMKQWRKDHLEEMELSESSADNYIRLAKKFDDTQTLIADKRPLRELYGASQKEADKLPPPTRPEKVMKDCTTLQRDLRLLKDSGEPLSKEQLIQLKLSKDAIDQDFETLFST